MVMKLRIQSNMLTMFEPDEGEEFIQELIIYPSGITKFYAYAYSDEFFHAGHKKKDFATLFLT